ncbi:MAG: sigma-54-dependent Fis family transcriptional regulator [Proteobacteria bacterium]|nr:sigma-54-dependent Fis family transcriptional regulator [Pseudomonadota bacterium]
MPTGLVSDAVIRSWERSRGQGLGAADRRVFSPISRQQVAWIEERNRRLVEHALPEMEKLRAALARGGWGIVCTDADGVVVKALYGAGSAYRDMDRIFEVGRSIGESSIGTTGPGCALVDRQPVVVRAAEHFLDEIRGFSCASVPIFDPAGDLAGVLDATRYCNGGPVTVLEPLAIAARAVENRMLAGLGAALTMGFHYRPDLLGTPLEGVIAFAETGQVLGANGAARQLLELAAEGQAGMDFGRLFDCPPETFVQALSGRLTQGVVWSDGGLRFEARFEAARKGSLLACLGEAARTAQRAGTPPLMAAAALPAAEPSEVDGVAERALQVARRAFQRDIPVLINGETGTGKEVLARHLHEGSERAGGPFVAINCSSLPAGLIESEFFGYEDGAFTGGRRGGAPGKFELARGGTLFLDEIGDMPLELQGRLLRVLQERSFTRLGGAKLIAFDARIVAATHRSLDELVAAGRFREDLYYRIKGVRVSLPALRERADREALLERLLRREAGDGPCPPLAPEARRLLLAYRWPGNIRQLGHVLRLALTLADGEAQIDVSHLPEELLEDASGPSGVAGSAAPDGQASLRDLELDAVRAAMEKCGGNVSAAARCLGVARATLYRKLRLLEASGA